MANLLVFLVKVVVISISGVMAPGPVMAATISAGAKNRHAGALVAIGHGIVEFPLIFLIMAGMGRLFESEVVKIIIGLAGGLFLLFMGVGMLRNIFAAASEDAEKLNAKNPIWIGIALSAGNPYFLLWWATIGLALAQSAQKLGVIAFVIFAVVHWLCDLFWLEAISLATFNGARVMGPKPQRIILIICGVAVVIFGVWFIFDAVKILVG